jgi:hypothetical protein
LCDAKELPGHAWNAHSIGLENARHAKLPGLFSAAILTKIVRDIPQSDTFSGVMKIWSFYLAHGVTKADLLRT